MSKYILYFKGWLVPIPRTPAGHFRMCSNRNEICFARTSAPNLREKFTSSACLHTVGKRRRSNSTIKYKYISPLNYAYLHIAHRTCRVIQSYHKTEVIRQQYVAWRYGGNTSSQLIPLPGSRSHSPLRVRTEDPQFFVVENAPVTTDRPRRNVFGLRVDLSIFAAAQASRYVILLLPSLLSLLKRRTLSTRYGARSTMRPSVVRRAHHRAASIVPDDLRADDGPRTTSEHTCTGYHRTSIRKEARKATGTPGATLRSRCCQNQSHERREGRSGSDGVQIPERRQTLDFPR